MSSQAKINHIQSSQAGCAVSETVSNRKVVSAWIMGGGIWLLGMLALLVVPMMATDVKAGSMTVSSYYAHSGNCKTVTDASGKYTAVVRNTVQTPGS